LNASVKKRMKQLEDPVSSTFNHKDILKSMTKAGDVSFNNPLRFIDDAVRPPSKGSPRFGTLSHHSFFSRHNPHPHRVTHIQGLNGNPVCMVNDDWYASTPLCPHPLIRSQFPMTVLGAPGLELPFGELYGGGTQIQGTGLLSEAWREELKDLAAKVCLAGPFEKEERKIIRMFGANENNGTILNMKRGLVSMFQFQQHSGSIIENDVSGKCSVTYAVSQNQVLKLKNLQSCENPTFGHTSANKVFGVNWQGIIKSVYSVENSLIKSVVSEETHVISLNLQSTVGSKITSRQQLELLTTHTGAAEFSGPRFEEILTALQGSYIPIDLNAGPLKKKPCTNCPSVTDYMKTLRKKRLEMYNVSTVKNFLKMVRLLREAEKKEIIHLLRKAEDSVIYLKFTDEKQSPLLKKFLYACAFSSHPTKDLLNTLTNVLKGEITEKEIQEIAIIALGGVLGKMCAMDLCKLQAWNVNGFVFLDVIRSKTGGGNHKDGSKKTVQEVELAKNLILERLINTDEVSEIKTYLLALKSALLPETIPLFLQYTEKPSTVSAIALSALQRFPSAHIDNKVKDQMRRIFHQRGKSFGETVRLAAADILLNNIPQHVDIRNIILAIGKEGPEVSKYLASKIQSILHSDHVAKNVILQVLEDPMLNNYNHLSRIGSSSTYSGYFTATKDMVSPYHLDFLFSENGFLRQINSNFFTHSHGNQMHSLQVSIEAKGLQSFFGGDTEEEEEEEAMAGMSAMLFNVQLRPVVFFQGYSDLMEKFWAATGEPENILKGTILIIDHLQVCLGPSLVFKNKHWRQMIAGCDMSAPAQGLKHTAVAAIGQEISQIKLRDNKVLSNWESSTWTGCKARLRKEATVIQSKEFKDEELLYVKQGKEALQRAVEILEQQGGWQTEISAVLHQVDKDTMVTHEVTAETSGNLIGQRDFVSIRHCWKQKASFYLAGVAIQLESLPPQKGFGWLPKSIVNQALPQAQADFTRHLRKRLSVQR
ncbi:Microsomal triglyceride transfer protein large subunit, partial [Acipenser ruthenus]